MTDPADLARALSALYPPTMTDTSEPDDDITTWPLETLTELAVWQAAVLEHTDGYDVSLVSDEEAEAAAVHVGSGPNVHGTNTPEELALGPDDEPLPGPPPGDFA